MSLREADVGKVIENSWKFFHREHFYKSSPLGLSPFCQTFRIFSDSQLLNEFADFPIHHDG